MKKVLFVPLITLFLITSSCKKETDYNQIDEDLIVQYISDNNLDAIPTGSGLYYVIENTGNGDFPNINSTVTVAYKGTLIDGTIFDQSGPSGATFPLLNVIQGWQEGIPLFSEKDKGMWDAWNKGFKLATGKFVGIVDSSNVIYPNAMKILSRYMLSNTKLDFVCGTVIKDGITYGGYKWFEETYSHSSHTTTSFIQPADIGVSGDMYSWMKERYQLQRFNYSFNYIGNVSGTGVFNLLYNLLILIPSLAVAVRRLHDVGKSGWMLLIGLIPLVGAIWLLILLLRDSEAGENKYGPNPK